MVAETDRKRPRRRTGVFVILVIAVFTLGFSEVWGISAICPKCLQGASITVVKAAGIPVFKWTTYSPHTHISPSWSAQTVSVPDVLACTKRYLGPSAVTH